MGLKHDKDQLIHMPVSLSLCDCKVKQLLPVYLAVACSANHAVNNKMVTKLSLRDIIYTIGLKPRSGSGNINEQVAVAVKTLSELGYFSDAPDYFKGERLNTKTKYRYEVVKPMEAMTYMTIAPSDIYNLGGVIRGKYIVYANGKKRRIKFSYDTLLHVLFAIKWRILHSKSGVIFVSRKTLQEDTGVSPRTISEITNVLHKQKIIMKKLYDTSKTTICGDDSIVEKRQIAFYADYYDGSEAKIINEYEKYEELIKSKAVPTGN